MQRLKEKWSLESYWQVVAVLIIFSLAGSSVVALRKWLFEFLGYSDQTATWIKVVTYLVFVFPAYQMLLLAYGFLLGQFGFFWEKEKRMVQWVARRLGR